MKTVQSNKCVTYVSVFSWQRVKTTFYVTHNDLKLRAEHMADDPIDNPVQCSLYSRRSEQPRLENHHRNSTVYYQLEQK